MLNYRKVKNLEQINDLNKLVKEIEQFQIKHKERPSCNDFEKGYISNYESLKKTIKDHIKVIYNWLIHVLKLLSLSMTDILYFVVVSM